MSVTRTLTAVACLALAAGCGGSSPDAAGKTTSFEEAIGLDRASINARETKVQEKVRACMKAQGFDYVPIDPSQGKFQISIGGISGGTSERDDPTFRRTKGYGITTGFTRAERAPSGADKDPNQAIREQLSESDQKAYDLALYGASSNVVTDGGGGVRVSREAGPSSKGKAGGVLADAGCFGKAQQQVPGGPDDFRGSLEELDQRITSDTRLVQASREWASCMSTAGFDQFESPRDIERYLIEKMQALSGPPSTAGDGSSSFTIGGDDMDPVALAALQKEELTIAKLDYECRASTGLTKVLKKVQEEAQQRFLDEHPDLTGGS